jgi:hypothetical protein
VLTATTSSGDALLDPAADSSFTVTMRAAAFDLIGRLNPATATSVNSGDRLVVALDTTIAKDSGAYPYETFTTTCRYSGAAAAAEPDDDILQSDAWDIVLLRWEHPRDPRDTAVLAIATTGATLAPPSVDPAPGTYQQSALEVTLADANAGVPAVLHYALGDGPFEPCTGPVLLEAGEGPAFTIRAYASIAGPLSSDTLSFTYTLESSGTAVLSPTLFPAWSPEQQPRYDAASDAAPAGEFAPAETKSTPGIRVKARALFSPDEPIPPSLLARLAPGKTAPPRRGTMIGVTADTPIRLSRSRVRIYDAVGNLVAEQRVPYAERGDPTRCWFLWHGRTRAGRVAGAGTYLAVVTVELADGTHRTKRIRLGVR